MNAMSERVRRGERVEVKLTGLVVDQDVHTLTVRVASGSGAAFCDVDLPLSLPEGPSWPNVQIERVAPAEWPPQSGDLWKDDQGEVWWFYQSEHDQVRLCRRNRSGAYEEGVETVKLLEQGPWTLVLRTQTPFDEEPPF